MHSKKAKRQCREAKRQQHQAAEEEELRRASASAEARGEKLSFGKMSVRTQKMLRKLDEATNLARREAVARWKEDVARAQQRESRCKDS